MTISANSSGVVSGQFTIPAGVPAGIKRVEFNGAGGSHGEATFSGTGTLTKAIEVLTQTWQFWQVDPLAQTFSLPSATQIAAVDLWFIAKGATPVVIQIRGTTAGFPNQTIHAEARVSAASILTSGNTRITFPAPVSLQANTEYALVVLCDNPTTSLAVAELGKWDSAHGAWVTSQPYQVGVLLSSSNASTWTAHQDRDMAFVLHRAVYTETGKTVALGAIAVTDATDLMLLTLDETPSSNTRIDYRLTLPDASVVTVSNGQPVRLAAPITGNVTVSAQLTGTTDSAPVLHPGAQLVVGAVAATGTYVSRAIPGGTGIRVKAVFDAILPAGASVLVEYKGAGSWTTLTYVSSKQLDDGFVELTHEVSGITATTVQLRLTLSGTTAARPRVRDLRFVTI